MELIGLLDSPYVRRVAVSLRCLGIPFEHRPLSVFRDFDEFRSVQPLVKAPTLVLDDDTALVDSGLILEFAERVAPEGRSLLPVDEAGLRRTLRVIGVALVACEKAIAIVYERNLRPPEKQHQPWIDRVTDQLQASCRMLDDEFARQRPVLTDGSIRQDGITTAVAWGFLQLVVPDVVSASDYPRVREVAAAAEELPPFLATPLPEFTSPSADGGSS